MGLFFIDCEAYGNTPRKGRLTEFGAVLLSTNETFYGMLLPSEPSQDNPAIPTPTVIMSDEEYAQRVAEVFAKFDSWISRVNTGGRPVMVSDNPAFDWQWINDGFHWGIGRNPLGHSARRIGDFYAGLVSDFRDSNSWKSLRVTKHDHHPVHDALGNAEAFRAILAKHGLTV